MNSLISKLIALDPQSQSEDCYYAIVDEVFTSGTPDLLQLELASIARSDPILDRRIRALSSLEAFWFYRITETTYNQLIPLARDPILEIRGWFWKISDHMELTRTRGLFYFRDLDKVLNEERSPEILESMTSSLIELFSNFELTEEQVAEILGCDDYFDNHRILFASALPLPAQLQYSIKLIPYMAELQSLRSYWIFLAALSRKFPRMQNQNESDFSIAASKISMMEPLFFHELEEYLHSITDSRQILRRIRQVRQISIVTRDFSIRVIQQMLRLNLDPELRERLLIELKILDWVKTRSVTFGY